MGWIDGMNGKDGMDGLMDGRMDGLTDEWDGMGWNRMEWDGCLDGWLNKQDRT